jgi:hypothetical protein
MSFRVPEPLRSLHILDGFDCGNNGLNDWLIRFARQSHSSGPAKTFVVADERYQVVGYLA